MQFVFNHTTFDPNDKMDQAVLAALKPLGVEPGKAYDPNTVAKINGKKFAVINGTEYEAGDAIGASTYVIDSIEARQVILKLADNVKVKVAKSSIAGLEGQEAEGGGK